MTEVEWLAGDDPRLMLAHVGERNDDRRLRLLVCACARRLWHLFPNNQCRAVIELGEHFADRLESLECLVVANREMWELLEANLLGANPTGTDEAKGTAIRVASIAVANRVNFQAAVVAARWSRIALAAESIPDLSTRSWEAHDATAPIRLAEQKEQCVTVRDIFGNPFRPVAFSPEWRTPTVLQLALGIYDSRDFSTLPILADALQDAGCDNDDILNHFRDPNATHVRGCWALDLVLGKE